MAKLIKLNFSVIKPCAHGGGRRREDCQHCCAYDTTSNLLIQALKHVMTWCKGLITHEEHFQLSGYFQRFYLRYRPSFVALLEYFDSLNHCNTTCKTTY